MTKAAKAFGKDIKDFFDNKSTTEYMDELSRLIGGNGPVKETKRGNGNLPTVGTWGHPKTRRVLRPLVGCPVRCLNATGVAGVMLSLKTS